jgi:hypothetical protein
MGLLRMAPPVFISSRSPVRHSASDAGRPRSAMCGSIAQYPRYAEEPFAGPVKASIDAKEAERRKPFGSRSCEGEA